jgi:hypothetical protein
MSGFSNPISLQRLSLLFDEYPCPLDAENMIIIFTSDGEARNQPNARDTELLLVHS